MNTLFIMCGVSYSGKSTIAHWLRKRLPKSIIICPDTIREELSGDAGNQNVSGRAFKLAYERTRLALRAGYDVIFDATSLRQSDRARLYKIAEEEGAEAMVEYCVCDHANVKERRKSRARVVPSDVVDRQFEKLEKPDVNEAEVLKAVQWWFPENILRVMNEEE